jgi:hypothetical protein
MSMPSQIVVIEPTHISGERGQWYRVHHGGAVLIEHTWNPEYDAARALVAKGVTGRVEVWRAGKPHADTTFIAERAAKLTIEENEKVGPRLIPWKAFAGLPGRSETADLDLAATLVA